MGWSIHSTICASNKTIRYMKLWDPQTQVMEHPVTCERRCPYFLTHWNHLGGKISKKTIFSQPKVSDGATIKELCKNSGKYVKRWSRNETLHWLHDDSRTPQGDSQICLQSLCQCSESDLVSVKPITSIGNLYSGWFTPRCVDYAFY